MKIALVHLTDIHFTSKSDYEQKIHPLCQAVISHTKGINNIYFVISGDIAYSGKDEEYEIAIKFLSLIKTLITQGDKTQSIKYVIVPGNHDCNFVNFDTQLRRIVLSNMNYQTIGSDNNVIDECLKVQDSFWKFYSNYNPVPEDKLFYTINDKIEGRIISFNCINTAWMSERDEKAGSIFFPVKRYSDFKPFESIKSFGVWHHPYNWFDPSTVENNKKEFEAFTEHISGTHFFGHEHQQTNYEIENKNSGSKIKLLSGDIFHEDKKPKVSGFQILVTSLESDKGTLIKFNLRDDIYYSAESEITFSKQNNKAFKLKDNFLNELQNIKIPLTIKGRKTIQLSDVYVFPDLDFEKSLSKSFDNFVNSKRLLDKDFRRCIIEGESQIGKSALLAQLCLNLYEKGYSPILLNGSDFKESSFDKMIKRAFKRAYEVDAEYERFYQSPPENLALLIDDFQDCDLNSAISKKLIEEAQLKFEKIIIVLDSASSFLSTIKSEFSDFKSYSIKPLGYKRRNDLIERYQYLRSDSHRIHEQDRLSAVKKSFDDVQSILGDKFMPSYPLFILGILQALEYKPSNLNETSSGYCYQALILYSLDNAGVTMEEIDTYFNFLTELAYEFIKTGKEAISTQELLKFYYEYQIKFIAPQYEKMTAIIKKSKLLIEDGELTFGYSYILYYLSAKKISDVLHTQEGKMIINALFDNVHIERNASILVFVTHHSKDVSYIEHSILKSMFILENNSAMTLGKNDPFYSSLESFTEELINNVLETNRNPKTQRENELIEQDRHARQKEIIREKSASENFKEINEVMIPFHQAFRSIEIVGQILKNRKGSLEKPQLLQMVTEVYTAGFRTITYMIELLESSKDAIIQIISEETAASNSRYEIESKINRFIQLNNLHICLGVFIKLMHSVGTKELRNIYVEVANKLNTPASKLVTFSINSYYGTFSEKEIVSLVNEFKDNQVALSILRSRVKSYVYNRELDFRTKQKYADILNMTLEPRADALKYLKR